MNEVIGLCVVTRGDLAADAHRSRLHTDGWVAKQIENVFDDREELSRICPNPSSRIHHICLWET